MSPITLSCSILNVNYLCSVITTLDIIENLQCYNYHHFLSDYLSKLYSSMTIIHCNNVRMLNVLKVDEQVSRDDDICKLIHEKFHKKFYYSDMTSHMTVNTIFSGLHGPFWGFRYLGVIPPWWLLLSHLGLNCLLICLKKRIKL